MDESNKQDVNNMLTVIDSI